MKKILTCFFSCIIFSGHSQDVYKDSLNSYRAAYVKNHEVVTGDDKQFFRFYPIDEKYKVKAMFVKANGNKWLTMETSGTIKKTFRVYGALLFSFNDSLVGLNIYQSQNLMNMGDYKDYLFLPFTDLSSGNETYAAGRYIDLNIADIINNKIVIDFNKAYNPYCAYVSGKYNCPVPPKENQLPITIAAGEKTFLKSH